MKFCLYIAVLLFALFSVKSAQTQIYPLQHYSSENGLATRGIYDITQDRTGRMWFSTGIGISSYDGFSWTNYGEEQGVPKRKYSKIYCDEQGVIWTAPGSITDNVLYFAYGRWNKIDKVPESISSGSEITGLGAARINGNPVVCLSTYSGAYVFSDNGWKRFGTAEGLADDYIYSSSQNGKKFYLATRKGITVIEDGKADNSINGKIPPDFGTVLKTSFDIKSGHGKERIWILASNKIGYIEDENFRLVNSSFELPLKSVLDFFYLTVCNHGEVYFGNVWSRNILNSKSGEYFTLSSQNGFASDGNTSVFCDREDNVWFSDYRGIDKLNTLAFRNHSTLNGLGENDISAVTEIEPGVCAFGHNTGITIFRNYHFKYIPFEKLPGFMPTSSRVLDFFRDRSGSMWFAASKLGAGKINADGIIKWYEIPKGIYTYSVNEDKNGNIIASCQNGIYMLKDGSFEKLPVEGADALQCRRLFNFGDGIVWGVSPFGIVKIGDKKVAYIKNAGSISEKSSFALFKDDDGRMFAGNEKGLHEIINDSLVKFSQNGFEINDAVFSITKDKNCGYIWFGTSVNLVGWNGSGNIKKFNSFNGLVKGEISRAGLFIDGRNTMWIGTDAGLSRYIPSLDYGDRIIPVPEIIDVEDYFGNIYSPTDEISAGNGNAALKFRVRGISFVSEKMMEYRIKLDGYDRDWVIIKQEDINDITYKNLQPGNYRFRMAVRNFSGEWSNEVTSGEIKINGPFYKRWWFILLFVVLIIFNTLYFYNRYLRRKYTTFLENKVRQRTSELEASQNELRKILASLEETVDERTRELAQSETKFRSIIEQASDGIAIYELNSRKLLLANPAYAGMLGYTEEEMLNLTLYDIVAHDRDSIDHYIENVIKEDLILIQERFHRRKDNSVFPVEVSISMIYYHDIEAMCVLIRDITERRKIQHALHESERKFREIVELLPEAVYETDEFGNLTFVNKQGLKLFGYTREDNIIGKSIIESIAPEDREIAVTTMMEALSGKIPVGAKFTGIRKDGTRIPVYINKAPIVDRGKCLGIRGIAVDMTQQIIIEEKLRSNAEKLRELNATKDKFFSIIAHDLRAPFTGFLGFSELLYQEADNLSREEIKSYARALKNSAKNNFELLENLLQWGRLQSGAIRIKNEKIELSQCIENVLRLLRFNYENKEIEVRNNAAAPVYAKGDCNIVQLVLQNLLINSIKFTKRKGKIAIQCERNDGMVSVSVIDNGVGIPEETMKKLFTLNTHISSPGTEKEAGTGLGLLVCKEMIEKMNGKISVESAEKLGTTVTISIPSFEADGSGIISEL